MSYAENRKFGDDMLDIVRCLVAGSHFIRVSTFHEDTRQCADLVVDKAGIGVRVREYKYFENEDYRRQFTIRAKTESTKIMLGHGDFFFYGFVCPAYPLVRHFIRWTLINVDVLRCLLRDGDLVLPRPMQNGDGTAFYAFDIPQLVAVRPEVVTDCNWNRQLSQLSRR